MNQQLMNRTISDEVLEEGTFDRPTADHPITVLATAHVSQAAEQGVVGKAVLAHRDDDNDPWVDAVIALAIAGTAGGAASEEVHFAPGALKAKLRAYTVGEGGQPDGAGQITLVY